MLNFSGLTTGAEGEVVICRRFARTGSSGCSLVACTAALNSSKLWIVCSPPHRLRCQLIARRPAPGVLPARALAKGCYCTTHRTVVHRSDVMSTRVGGCGAPYGLVSSRLPRRPTEGVDDAGTGNV